MAAPVAPSDGALHALDRRLRQALDRGTAEGLEILGYGELSTTVVLEDAGQRFAVKRLPPFDDWQRRDAYHALFHEYIERAEALGVTTVPSQLHSLESTDGGAKGEGELVTYCVQPALEPSVLGPCWLASASPEASRRAAESLFETILATVGPEVGFDAQLSNWARPDGVWSYLDLTTPLLRTREGADRLDTDLFLAMLPWILRPLVRRFLLRGILATYFEPRRVLVDLLANLLKERLADHLPLWLEVANHHLVGEPIRRTEIGRYYRSDARLWAFLLALRRIDRWITRHALHRPYPFLLPGPIER